MGTSGVIGVNLKVSATGKINGLAVSQNNSDITGQTVGNLTVFAGGTANVSAQTSGAGITVVGIQGVNASGLGTGANLLGQNISVNGAVSQSTLGTPASATTASQSAAQQSSSDMARQVASNSTSDDDDKKKKNKGQPLLQRVKRVTVILPKEG